MTTSSRSRLRTLGPALLAAALFALIAPQSASAQRATKKTKQTTTTDTRAQDTARHGKQQGDQSRRPRRNANGRTPTSKLKRRSSKLKREIARGNRAEGTRGADAVPVRDVVVRKINLKGVKDRFVSVTRGAQRKLTVWKQNADGKFEAQSTRDIGSDVYVTGNGTIGYRDQNTNRWMVENPITGGRRSNSGINNRILRDAEARHQDNPQEQALTNWVAAEAANEPKAVRQQASRQDSR